MENGKMKMSTDSQENKDIKGKIIYNFSNQELKQLVLEILSMIKRKTNFLE